MWHMRYKNNDLILIEAMLYMFSLNINILFMANDSDIYYRRNCHW